MKVKRYKHAKKVLSFYKSTFKIREPYQVIVDGTFCHAALKGKIQIKEQLPKYLGGRIQLGIELVTHNIMVAQFSPSRHLRDL
jgi:U3 small nucleolar RNA-associated protein 23